MANIKNLQMWNSICADTRISVSKSLFGLRTTATYTPSNSVIDAYTFEYTHEDGEQLRHILETPKDKIASTINDFRPKATVNGNFLAEVCVSRDSSFIAVQLQQFSRMSYEPVTEVLLFEGDTARTLAALFR